VGSHSISNTVWFDGRADGNTVTARTAEAAWRHLYEQSLHEDGHGSYSGGFGTTSGVRDVRMAPVTVDEAQRIAWGKCDEGGRGDDLLKRERCEAIPLVRTTPATYTPTVEQNVTVTLTAAQAADRDKIKAAVAKAAGVNVGEVESFHTAKDKTWKPVLRNIVTRVKAITGKERIVTRYFVIGNHQDLALPTTAKAWLESKWGFDKVSEARAALERLAVEDQTHVGGAYAARKVEIIGVTRRTNGEPVVSASIEARTVDVTYTVATRTMLTPAKHGTTHAGWLIYGWAAS